MVDTKTIGISSLIALGIVLASVITPTFFDTPSYYCESESSIRECDGGLSGGKQTRCYLSEELNSWDYCSSGWVLVSDDRPVQEEPVYLVQREGVEWNCNAPESAGCTRVS